MKSKYVSMMALGILVIALTAPSFLAGQTIRSEQPASAPTAKEVYSWARTAKQKIPAGADWDKARPETETQRSMLRLIKRGQAIIERVVARGDAIPATEAGGYDRQMRTIVEQMDKLTAGGGASKSPASCHAECDRRYGGWGAGKGWNRFWCKVACFKLEIHVG